MKNFNKFPVLVYETGETDITTAGSTVTWNIGDIFNQLDGEYRKSGMRPYVLGFFIARRTNLTPTGLAPNNYVMLNSDRDPCFNIQINTPFITDNVTRQETNVLNWRLQAAIANPVFKLFGDKVKKLQGLWNPYPSIIEVPNYNAGIVGNQNRLFDVLDRTQGWGIDLNPLPVGTTAAPAAQEVIDPIEIPLCYYSGENRFGGTVQKDRLPLGLVANTGSPWTIQLTHRSDRSFQAVLDVYDATIKASLSINVSLHMVVTAVPMDDDYGFGLPINLRSLPVTSGSNFKPTSECFRSLTVAPNTNLPLTGAGSIADPYGLVYQPDDWGTIDMWEQLYRVLVCNNQVFPLTFDSKFGHLFTAWNDAADNKANPRLWMNYETVPTTRFKSLQSTIAATTTMNLWTEARGYRTAFPVLPLVANAIAGDGFAVGAMPGNGEQLEIQTGFSLTNDQASRVWALSFGTNRVQDIRNVASFEVNGCKPCGSGVQLPQYRAAINNSKAFNRGRFMDYLPVVSQRR